MVVPSASQDIRHDIHVDAVKEPVKVDPFRAMLVNAALYLTREQLKCRIPEKQQLGDAVYPESSACHPTSAPLLAPRVLADDRHLGPGTPSTCLQ